MPAPRPDDPTHALDDFIARLHAGGSAASGPAAEGPGAGASARPAATTRDPFAATQPDVLDAPLDVDLRAVQAAAQARPGASSTRPATAAPAAPGDPMTAGAAKAGMRRRPGSRADVTDIEDVEVRVPAPAPAEVDADALADSLARTSAAAAARLAQEDQAARAAAPQPDLGALGLRPTRHPRLAELWHPGAWVAVAHPLGAAATEVTQSPQGPVVQTYPAVQLVALWAPLARPDAALPRFPQRLMLTVTERQAATPVVLAHVPEPAPLWWRPAPRRTEGAPDARGSTGARAASPAAPALDADIDWSLLAELARLHLTRLRPAQAEALAELQRRAREADFARLNDAYAWDAASGAVRPRSPDAASPAAPSPATPSARH